MTRLVIYFNELRAWGERLENSSVPQAQCSLRGMSGEEYSWAYLCKKEKKHETSNLVNFMVSLHFKYLWGFNRERRGPKCFGFLKSCHIQLDWKHDGKTKNKAAWSLLPHLTAAMFSRGSGVHTSDRWAALQAAEADLYFNPFKVFKLPEPPLQDTV